MLGHLPIPLLLLLLLLASWLPLASAVFINFENCLEKLWLRDAARSPYLQFTPLYVWATFDTLNPNHRLNVTVYGNVSGQAQSGQLPDPTDAQWSDPNNTFGKIVDLDPKNNKYTTLFWENEALTYSAWASPGGQFCESVINGSCPLAPRFPQNGGNASDPYTLPAISVAHDFHSTYSFATWASTLRIVSGNADRQTLGCISANITPDLGPKLSGTLCYLPAAVLILIAVATVFAATCSPWGTTNVFRWTSNYGRDEDLLRLVTPGFGDCLQYIQFIVLSGSLSLNYPGFFQPVISQASWSVLLFNRSFVSQGNGSQSLVDGIYFTNGTYGMTRLGQYVGMTRERDIWACMAIFLLVLIAIVVLLVQWGFLVRWVQRYVTKTQDGDLKGKNWSFTAGCIVRIVFNYFMLPIVAISLFQLVVAPRSPPSVVAPAVVLLLLVACVATWIFWFIFTTRPRAHLFDDLPTVLTYGPLYNTYSDDAAPFAFIPVLLTVIRGIAIGALQPSGIAQIIILAICEIILILTLHAFRPFQSNTSMNAYHTFYSAVRLSCVLLMVAFAPSLKVSEGARGWIGYAILLLHAIVLVFGFFLNSLQTMVEITARLSGAGGDQRGGLSTVFGKRQLSKRNRNVHKHQRSSRGSNAAMLHDENKNIQLTDSRSRSMSASSGILLNGPYDRDSQRISAGFDEYSQGGHGNTSPGTPGVNATPFHLLGGSSTPSSRQGMLGTGMETLDPYYRPPRPRKETMDSVKPGSVSKEAVRTAGMVDSPYSDEVGTDTAYHGAAGAGEGPSRGSGTPAPAYLRVNREDSDLNLERRNNTDYSVRESDFYYGLRGPALSSQPTRKLKTGPADPVGPVSSATGWFKSLNLLGGRKKEKSKGFEVVRSTRIPPAMLAVDEEGMENSEDVQEPYRDSPDTPPRAVRGSEITPPRTQAKKDSMARSHPISSTSPRSQHSIGVASAGALAGRTRRLSDSDSLSSEEDLRPINALSAIAPTLGKLELGGEIELPSRIGSQASRVPEQARQQGAPSRMPTIPRRSSRRTRSTETALLPAEAPGVLDEPSAGNLLLGDDDEGRQHLQAGGAIRLPFGSVPSPSPEPSGGPSGASSMYSHHGAGRMAGGSDRRLSTGYVQHHVTRDSVHRDVYDAGSHLEASAEIVDRSRSGSTNRSRRSQMR